MIEWILILTSLAWPIVASAETQTSPGVTPEEPPAQTETCCPSPPPPPPPGTKG